MSATRYAARLAYHGAAYYGFQRQVADQPTVQATVEDALAAISGQAVTITGAGRTDSGVHASGQVIAFALDWDHGPHTLRRAANAHLPPDVALQRVIQAPDDFHPRFDARRRTYLYRLLTAPVRDPLRRDRVWHWRQSLDVTAMQAAAAQLVGEHDFATFGQAPQGDNTVRHIYVATLAAAGDELHFTVTANAFLQRMVRSIVGTLVDVGRGKMTVAAFGAALQAAQRSRAGPSAPPQGLVLTRVLYDSAIDRLFEAGPAEDTP